MDIKRETIVMKGSVFTTEVCDDGEVMVRWADESGDFDVFDFWKMPAADVEANIARLREGIYI